jgi:photosystem II stability/assembly factor-like uncharacterized protein
MNSHLRFAVTLMLIGLALTTVAAAQPQRMQRFSSDVGFADGFWTTDSGKHWREMNLPNSSIATFFLNPTTGWAVTMDGPMGEDLQFAIATTRDSGQSWSMTPIKLPIDQKQTWLAGQDYLQFTDPLHGWLNLSIQSGSAFDFGILLKTVDGGKTWIRAGGPGTAEEMHFINAQDGWQLGPHRRELWVTHDGSKTWQQVSLKPPADLKPADEATYLLPVFGDDKHGAVEAAFTGLPTASEDVCHTALFVTSDGGQRWDLKAMLVKQKACGSWWLFTAAGSVLITPTVSDEKLTLKKVSLDGTSVANTTTADLGFLSYVDGISFSNPQQGWVSLTACCEAACSTCVLKPSPRVSCTAVANRDRPLGMQCRALLSTDDGGKTWTDITLRQRCVQEGPTAKKTCTVEK